MTELNLPELEQELRFATTCFSDSEWSRFERDGLIVRRDVFGVSEVEALKECCIAFEKIASEALGPVEGGFRHTLGVSSEFARLVCDERLLGPAYDLFGEMTALHSFELFIRPPGGKKEHPWHFDGPRRLPYAIFGSTLPHVLKLGVWLTDVDAAKYSAYQYVPGSHIRPCGASYGRSDTVPGQETLQVRAGDVSIHHCDLWHHVTPNRGPSTRYNFFIAYSPSWISPREPFDDVDPLPDRPELASLLRSYSDLTFRFKPPSDETPIHPSTDPQLMRGERLGRAPIKTASKRKTEIT